MIILLLILIISPVDLIPDVIPIIGWLDDIAYLVALVIIANETLR